MEPFSFLFMTNKPAIAIEAEQAGVDWIFVDLEKRGKRERQQGRNTIISDHTIDDASAIRQVLQTAKLVVRINPLSSDTELEVAHAIEAGADALMLPMFTTPDDVAEFVRCVAGRAQCWILLETGSALERVQEIVCVRGIDRLHVGLNDLHLSLGLSFMYETLANGHIDRVASAVKNAPTKIRFGFGGGARISEDHPVTPTDVIREHLRLGSDAIILSRTFHRNPESIEALQQRMDLKEEIRQLRQAVGAAAARTPAAVEADRQRIQRTIQDVARSFSR